MTNDLSDTDVIAEVFALEQDPQGQMLRQDVLRRRQQHAMTDVPWLPDHLTRGVTAVMPSVEPAYLAQTIGADMSSYITTTIVIPGNPDLAAKADKVEKRYAIERAELFPLELRARMRWAQMIAGYGVYQFGYSDPSKAHPWWVEMPDPRSTFFRLLKGGRPTVVGRRYMTTIREIESNPAYNDMRQGRRPKFKDGKWDWEAIDFDVYTSDNRGAVTGRGQAIGEQCEFVELDTGTRTYCVALHRDGKAGQVIWNEPNLGGGTHYMIVPGHMTDARELREMLLPFLWAPMNIANQIQLIDTIRMTRSLNIKPQVLVDRNPDLLSAARTLGIAREPMPGQTTDIVGDSLIEVDGHPYFWEAPDDQDLDKLESRLEERLARYSQTQLALTTGEVVANVTVGGLQLALGARQRQQGPMLSFEDNAEAAILGMLKNSIVTDGGFGAGPTNGSSPDWGLYGRTQEVYSKGETAKGDWASFNKDMLNFEHEINVSTSSKTREEAGLEVQNWERRKVSKLSTWREGISAAGYSNEQEQYEALIDDEAYEAAAQIMGDNLVQKILIAEWVQRAGIDISGMVVQTPGPSTGVPGSTSGGGASPTPPPATGGATGGSTAPELGTGPAQQ